MSSHRSGDNHESVDPIAIKDSNSAPIASNQEAREDFGNVQNNSMSLTDILLILVGFLQFGGLIGGIIVYCWQAKIMTLALRASHRGVRAAQRTARIAEDALTVLEAPYVFCFGLEKLERDFSIAGGSEPFVKLTIANYGKTPAVIENICAGVSVEPTERPQAQPRLDDSHEMFISPVMKAGEERKGVKVLAPDNFRLQKTASHHTIPALGSEEYCFFWISIEYRDVFERRYENRACWILSDLDNRFKQYGHDQYNYVRRIHPAEPSHRARASWGNARDRMDSTS